MKIYDLLTDTNYSNKKVLEKLISYYLSIPRETIYAHYENKIPFLKLRKIKKSYKEFYVNKKPLEYIFWYVEFCWNQFFVNKDTLIPRPETEYMINAFNDFFKNSKNNYTVIDIWTWSGILWISSLIFNPSKVDQLYLTEISKPALKVARKNLKKHIQKDLRPRVKIKYSDLFNLFVEKPKLIKSENVVLVANLPYIPDEVFEENVEENVKKREPRVAFLWWEQWINLYIKMFDQILEYVNINKTKVASFDMFLEMMTFQIELLENIYKDQLDFEVISTFHFNIKILKVSVKLNKNIL